MNDANTAGDYVKFGFPMAYTTTVLAWGMVEYANAYENAGLAEAGRAQLRWATDYFIKVRLSSSLSKREVFKRESMFRLSLDRDSGSSVAEEVLRSSWERGSRSFVLGSTRGLALRREGEALLLHR